MSDFRLSNLNLDHNKIVEIRAHCFRLSRNLAVLNIRDNKLGTLDAVCHCYCDT